MKCSLLNNHIAVSECFDQKDRLKNEFGARWNEKNKVWLLGATLENAKKLKNAFNPVFDDIILGVFRQKQSRDKLVKDIKNGSYSARFDFSKLINVPLMEHQVKGANIAMEVFDNNGSGVMFSMEMGTGKTMTAMATIGKLAETKGIKRVLVVCPKVAMQVWEQEYDKFANYKYCLRVISGTPKRRLQRMNELAEYDGLQIAVINYEYCYTFSKVLTKWCPDTIICDESHKIKSPTSNQTKAIVGLGNNARYKICLTGTPLTNNILDFFSQYKFLDSTIFGDSFTNYKNKYVITGMFNEYLRPNPRTFEDLKEKVDSIAYRVTKEECLTLPPFVDIPVYVELDNKTMTSYKQFETEFVTWLNSQTYISADNALTQTLRLRQLTGGFIYTKMEDGNTIVQQVDNAKLEACKELIEEIVEQGNKVVVFAEFQSEIKAIKEMCDKLGVKSGTYYGATNEKDRKALVDGFQNGDVQVFIGQIESAGISITLTSAKYMIFFSTGYKYGVYDQARARIHRKGQTNKCTYYHLTVKHTIDEKILRSLQKKEALAESIIDDYRSK